jgi:hypothetical protein
MRLDRACENLMPMGSLPLSVGVELRTHEFKSLVELTRVVGAALHTAKKLGHNQCATSFQDSETKRA